MTKNNNLRAWIDAVLYIIIFAVMQFVCVAAAGLIVGKSGISIPAASGMSAATMATSIGLAAASLLTIGLFVWRSWSPFSRSYLRSKPWVVLFWVALLSIGTILPSEWLLERMQVWIPSLPVNDGQLDSLVKIMETPLGYVIVGILAPVCEEMVFRGAVLRRLLTVFSPKNHWWAIVASALLFAVMHFDVLQGTHAFIIGLLLGWMYYRSGSIVPGILFHWINNTVAFVMIKLMPQMADGKLIDLFHGDDKLMASGLLCSLCVLIPSLLQVAVRMRRPK